MKKKIGIVSLIVCLIIIIMCFGMLCNVSNAETTHTTANPLPASTGSSDLATQIYGSGASLANAGGIIIGSIKWIGTAVLIGAVIVKGIQFVSSSPEGQAKIKNEIILLVIGAVLLFTFTSILKYIEEIVIESGLQNG